MTELGRCLQFQIISFVLILLVLILYSGRRKLHIIREKVFSVLIFASFFSVVLDILSIILLEGYIQLPDYLVNACRKCYLISVTIVAFCVLLYTSAEIYQKNVFKGMRSFIFTIPIIVAIPLISNFNVQGKQAGIFGLSVYVSMTISALYMFISCCYGIRYYKLMVRLRFFAIILSAAVFGVCGVIQIYNQDIRIISVGISLIIIYMYLGLEPPDVYVDRVLDTFNRDAFHIYLKNMCGEGKRANILYILIKDSTLSRNLAGLELINGLMQQICSYLHTYKGAKVFSNGQDSFMMVFEKDEYFMDYVQAIRNKFRQPWKLEENRNVYGERKAVECEVGAAFIAYPAHRMPQKPDSQDILDTLRYFYKVALGDYDNNSYICIDRKQIREKDAVKQLRSEIADVIKEDRVDVYFQPIYSVHEDMCREVEVLMRVRDKRDIYYDNAHILPVAEETGQIIEIGYEVFRKACRFLATNDLKLLGIERVAVNLSFVQCQQGDLSERFAEIMDSYNVSASYFRFEITENMARYITKHFRRNINQLIALGATFAIDDFGSSAIDVDLIKRVSKDYIKLAEKTVQEYFDGSKSKLSFKLMCKMLLSMKMQVVAVGVEDEQQYAQLKSMGITHMQGKIFAKPLSEEKLVELLQRDNVFGMGQEVMFERKL